MIEHETTAYATLMRLADKTEAEGNRHVAETMRRHAAYGEESAASFISMMRIVGKAAGRIRARSILGPSQ